MATVDDAIELLRDPLNLTYLGDPTAGLGVKTHRVVRLLRERGVESEKEALALIRKASRALGGDEVLVQRPGALRADRLGSAPRRAEPAFWVSPQATARP
jgi:precorrin-6B methylase 2